jgi:hypothetical protein
MENTDHLEDASDGGSGRVATINKVISLLD